MSQEDHPPERKEAPLLREEVIALDRELVEPLEKLGKKIASFEEMRTHFNLSEDDPMVKIQEEKAINDYKKGIEPLNKAYEQITSETYEPLSPEEGMGTANHASKAERQNLEDALNNINPATLNDIRNKLSENIKDFDASQNQSPDGTNHSLPRNTTITNNRGSGGIV